MCPRAQNSFAAKLVNSDNMEVYIKYKRLPESHLYIGASEKLPPSPSKPSSFPEVNWCNCNQTPENGAPKGTVVGGSTGTAPCYPSSTTPVLKTQREEEIKAEVGGWVSFFSGSHSPREQLPPGCAQGSVARAPLR